MKESRKIKISFEIEKILKDFCLSKNKDIDEFIEEAILEKIEKEEIKENVIEIINSDDYREEILKEYILDEFEVYKKKH